MASKPQQLVVKPHNECVMFNDKTLKEKKKRNYLPDKEIFVSRNTKQLKEKKNKNSITKNGKHGNRPSKRSDAGDTRKNAQI